MKAVLGLEDGTHVVGEGFGVEGCATGELVFTTQMTGYMEALTDPSYHGQILMFTYPLIGNYGVDVQNAQSDRVWAAGCVVREICASPARRPSLARYFEDQGLSGIAGVDTRALAIRLRECGTMRSCLLVGSTDAAEAVRKARELQPITDIDLIPGVTTRAPYRVPGPGKRIAVIDLGIKKNMITSLCDRGADLTVFPADATARDVLATEPQALFISNGPGDPKRATAAIECVRSCIGDLPIFGICMGIQVTALALGGETFKLKFGHRGANQPVRHTEGKIFITTQNHGFHVVGDSLPEGCRPSYVNVNDGTLEGFENRDLNIACVQFHPEAHGGPRDTEAYFFDEMFRRIP